MPNDFHLVHLGGKALGGAGLVMTEMVCVSRRRAGSRPAAPGSGPTSRTAAWRRIVDFVHARVARPRSGIQLGHSGRKGSTKLMWEGIDEPLRRGQLGGRRARRRCPTGPASTRCRASSTLDDLDEIKERVRRRRAAGGRGRLRPARAALRARLPAVVVHLAADQPAHRRVRRRRWRTGCATRSRCSTRCARSGRRDKPMTVRISATDWVEGGIDADDAVEIAARVRATPAPTRSTCRPARSTPDERPAFGRSYQTPYADRDPQRGRHRRRSRSA